MRERVGEWVGPSASANESAAWLFVSGVQDVFAGSHDLGISGRSLMKMSCLAACVLKLGAIGGGRRFHKSLRTPAATVKRWW